MLTTFSLSTQQNITANLLQNEMMSQFLDLKSYLKVFSIHISNLLEFYIRTLYTQNQMFYL